MRYSGNVRRIDEIAVYYNVFIRRVVFLLLMHSARRNPEGHVALVSQAQFIRRTIVEFKFT